MIIRLVFWESGTRVGSYEVSTDRNPRKVRVPGLMGRWVLACRCGGRTLLLVDDENKRWLLGYKGV